MPLCGGGERLREAGHNYLYLDGHVSSLTWEAAVPDLFHDKVVLYQDSSYP